MMNFLSRSPKVTDHSSLAWHSSTAVPGVRFATRRVSLAQRIELTQRIRELCLQHEFLKAGDAAEQVESALGDLLIRKLYLEWGVAEIRGFRIDHRPATVETVIQSGPETLADEMIAVLKSEIGLTEDERKNS